ncbi:D-alanyl-D-alanine carboxypeptidase family protein [Neobacillus sp. 114]|uniref:D-alanyl-D-alanine carboxypeptidase family protein n=1 Tax=Neobacillus sp. 114 TaxID=3048535 RepID=UPI0024C22189|nr:D-alanyl-D-alanine carboxypeptidase family protein [Neobacillus sp. 114]
MIIKKIPVLLVSTLCLFGVWVKGSNGPEQPNLPIRAEAALLMDFHSGRVLFSKNESEKLFPASTTKVLTAWVAIKHGDLNEQVKVGKEVSFRSPGESTAWLKEGQTLTLRELLIGMMLPSGNDAARTVAVHIGKKHLGTPNISDEEAINHFVAMMNQQAEEVGANHSHFMNPTGLHHPEHYSTAEDLALISKAVMKHKDFQEIVNLQNFTNPLLTYQNTNKLLDSNSTYYFKGTNGIKTGFTDEAGYCLISSAERNGKEYIAVVLKSSQDGVWKDSTTLLNKGFSTSP